MPHTYISINLFSKQNFLCVNSLNLFTKGSLCSVHFTLSWLSNHSVATILSIIDWLATNDDVAPSNRCDPSLNTTATKQTAHSFYCMNILNILFTVFILHNYRVHLFFLFIISFIYHLHNVFSLQRSTTKIKLSNITNEFVCVCESMENLDVFELIKHQINILKATIIERRVQEINT